MLADGVEITQELALQAITTDRIVQEAKKQLMVTGRELLKRIQSPSDATLSWLNQYQKSRFEVTVDTSELAKEVEKFSRFGRPAIIAILLVGMFIGTSIAT